MNPFTIKLEVQESVHKNGTKTKKMPARIKKGLIAAVTRAVQQSQEYGDLKDPSDRFRSFKVTDVTITESDK